MKVKGLPTGAKMVLATLADQADDRGESFSGHESLAQLCGCTRRSIMRHLDYLKENGFITIRPRFKDRLKTSNLYTINIAALPDLPHVTQSHIDVTGSPPRCDSVSKPCDTESHKTPSKHPGKLNGGKSKQSTRDTSLEEDLEDTSWVDYEPNPEGLIHVEQAVNKPNALDATKHQRDEKITELAGESKSQREIVAQVGVSQDTVKNVDRKRNTSEIVQPEPNSQRGKAAEVGASVLTVNDAVRKRNSAETEHLIAAANVDSVGPESTKYACDNCKAEADPDSDVSDKTELGEPPQNLGPGVRGAHLRMVRAGGEI